MLLSIVMGLLNHIIWDTDVDETFVIRLVPFVQFKKLFKNTHGGMLALVKLQAKSNTPPWVFFTFFRLYKWYQIAQRITWRWTWGIFPFSQSKVLTWVTSDKKRSISFYWWKLWLNILITQNHSRLIIYEDISTFISPPFS